MNKIVFATTNEGKLKEAKEILKIEVEGAGLPIDEIQSLDSVEVATKKAQEYFKRLKKPILVEDVSLTFNQLGKLPGPYINDFSGDLGNKGLLKLITGRDRSAVAETVLVFIDKKGKVNVFRGITNGQIAKKLRGKEGFGWDPIFIPKGSKKTFAEMDLKEKNKYSMRAKAFNKFRKWLYKSSE